MNLGLEGKVVLIAACPDGAAPALASTLLHEGARVVFHTDSVKASKGADTVYRGELTDTASAEALRDELISRFGALDAMIYYADTPKGAALMETRANALREGLGAARTAFLLCKVFGEWMGAHGGGGIVLITTLHDEKPNGADVAHSMAQGMVENLAMEATLEYGGRNVRVNQIALGAAEGSAERFETDITSFYEGCRYKAPSGRLAEPEDAAELAAFLLSQKAAYINGARIRMDGGLSLHYLDFKANRRALAARESRQP